MTTVVSAANLGGVADARLGDEADVIGTSEDHRGGISSEIGAPDPHGHNTIYLDNSITFENYHYWANRSREFEKHIRTDNAGLQGIANILMGRKIPNSPPKLDNPETNSPSEKAVIIDEKATESNGESNGNGHSVAQKDGWTHGVTESEWEQAQRATRTATWGE
jgi:hypothetical protein